MPAEKYSHKFLSSIIFFFLVCSNIKTSMTSPVLLEKINIKYKKKYKKNN
jgi:hypothetical protein